MRTSLILALGLAVTAEIAAAGPVLLTAPAVAPETVSVTCTERWRLDGNDPDLPLLGVVDRAVMDAEGNVFLLDIQEGHVLQIGPGGELVRVLGGPGDGPGELSEPTDLCLLPGPRLGIVERFPGGLELLDLAGACPGDPAGLIRPARDAADGGMVHVFAAACRDGNLVAAAGVVAFSLPEIRIENYLAALDEDGGETARFAEVKRSFRQGENAYDEGEQNRVLEGCWTLGPGGIVHTAPEIGRYEIRSYGPDGALERILTRDLEPRRRTPSELDRLAARFLDPRTGQTAPHALLDHDPVIQDLHAAADGGLWVRNCYSRPEELPAGVFDRYDVFSPQGEFLREVSLVLAGDPAQDRLVFLDGRRFLLLQNIEGALRAWPGADGRGRRARGEGDGEGPFAVVMLQTSER